MCKCAYMRWPTHRRYEAVTDWLYTFSSVQSSWLSFFRKKKPFFFVLHREWVDDRQKQEQKTKILRNKWKTKTVLSSSLRCGAKVAECASTGASAANNRLKHQNWRRIASRCLATLARVTRLTCDTERVWRTSGECSETIFWDCHLVFTTCTAIWMNHESNLLKLSLTKCEAIFTSFGIFTVSRRYDIVRVINECQTYRPNDKRHFNNWNNIRPCHVRNIFFSFCFWWSVRHFSTRVRSLITSTFYQ